MCVNTVARVIELTGSTAEPFHDYSETCSTNSYLSSSKMCSKTIKFKHCDELHLQKLTPKFLYYIIPVIYCWKYASTHLKSTKVGLLER